MATSGAAMAEGAYVALDAGQSNYSGACNPVAGATTTACTDKPTSYRLAGGYNFTKNFGVEASYTDYGSISEAIRGTVIPFTNSVSGKTTAFQIAGTGTLPLSDSFSLTAKLGMAFASTKGTTTLTNLGITTVTSSSVSNNNLVAGIGAEYDFTKSLGLRINYETLGSIGNPATINLSNISAGLVVKF